jgi:hypothetical protein
MGRARDQAGLAASGRGLTGPGMGVAASPRGHAAISRRPPTAACLRGRFVELPREATPPASRCPFPGTRPEHFPVSSHSASCLMTVPGNVTGRQMPRHRADTSRTSQRCGISGRRSMHCDASLSAVRRCAPRVSSWDVRDSVFGDGGWRWRMSAACAPRLTCRRGSMTEG